MRAHNASASSQQDDPDCWGSFAIEHRDGSNSVALSSTQASQLRAVFVRYCSYGALLKSAQPEHLTGPKFEHLLRDAHILQTLGDQQRCLVRAIYLDDVALRMDFAAFLRALGHLAVVLTHANRQEAAPPRGQASPVPFALAVRSLLDDHVRRLTHVLDPGADQKPVSAPRVVDEAHVDDPSSITPEPIDCSDHDDEDDDADPQEHVMPVMVHSDADDDHHGSQTRGEADSHSGLIDVASFQSSSHTNGNDDVGSAASEDTAFSSTDLSRTGASFSAIGSESTASSAAHTITTRDLPIAGAAPSAKDREPQIIRLSASQVNLMESIFAQYAPHWCTGPGRDLAPRRSLRSHPPQTASGSRKRPRFAWVDAMCFGSFASFAHDFQLANRDSEDLERAFAAALKIPRHSVWQRSLQSHDFIRAAATLAALQAERHTRTPFIPFAQVVRELVAACQARFVRQCLCNMTTAPRPCPTCADPHALANVDVNALPAACRQDPETLALLEDARHELQGIFIRYCDHDSVQKTSLEPCRGARCAGPQPLLPQPAFRALARDFELAPRFLSDAQVASLFHAQALRRAAEARDGFRGHLEGDDTVADIAGDLGQGEKAVARISFAGFVAVLAGCAVKAFSRYPYTRLASSVREKVALFLKRVRVAPAFAEVLGPAAAAAAARVAAAAQQEQRRRAAGIPGSSSSSRSSSSSSTSTSTSSSSSLPSPSSSLPFLSSFSSLATPEAAPSTPGGAASSGISAALSASISAALSTASEGPDPQAARRRQLQRDYDRALRRRQARRRAQQAQSRPQQDRPPAVQTATAGDLLLRRRRAGAAADFASAGRTLAAPAHAGASNPAARRRAAPQPIRSLFAPRSKAANNADAAPAGHRGFENPARERITLEEKARF